MKLNCEAGKLAVVIKGDNIGKIFTTIRLVEKGDEFVSRCGMQFEKTRDDEVEATWHIDGFAVLYDGGIRYEVPIAADSYMRKLDGNVTEDDMALFAPTPSEQLEKV